MLPDRRTIRIAAVGDVHYGKSSQGSLQSLFAAANDLGDIFVLAGDLTDYGLPDEARLLAKDLSAFVRIPIVAVLGNHDFESGKQLEIASILTDIGVSVLDGDTCEVHGVGFAGIKGFAGGFGRGALGPWGENTIKLFVREAIDEALKLESALARLRNDERIALLHYAPVRGTVEGEPLEIFPYLGSSRLEEPLIRYPVSLVLHGHAHHGQVEGRTAAGTPVYNVSLPLMRERYPDRMMQIVEVPRAGEAAAPSGASTPTPGAASFGHRAESPSGSAREPVQRIR